VHVTLLKGCVTFVAMILLASYWEPYSGYLLGGCVTYIARMLLVGYKKLDNGYFVRGSCYLFNCDVSFGLLTS